MQHREPDQSRSTSLREYLRILRTYWAGMLVIVLLSVSVAAVWTITQTRVYSSTASGMVQAATGDDLNLQFAGDSLAKSRAESYVQQATSEEVAKIVIADLKLNTTPGALTGTISAQLPPDTAIINVTAVALTPQDAQKIANGWISALAKRVQQIESPDGEDSSTGTRFTPTASAPLNTSPTSPNVPTALALALVVGLFLAALFALIRNQLDRGVRSAEMVENAFGVSVIGTIPLTDELSDDSHVIGTKSGAKLNSASTMEALRELRTNLSYVDVDNPPRVLLVTSSMPSEGKSTLSANLAVTIARSGQPVVVVDADMRHPSQGKTFGMPDGAGLSDVLAGRVSLREVLQDPDLSPNLRVLSAGRTPPNPSELLGSRTMRELLVALSELAVVIVDAPPLLPVTDAAVLSKSVDGVLLVVNAKKTKIDQVGKALRALSQASGNLTGVVLNRVPRRGADAVNYGYYGAEYGYGYYHEASITAGEQSDDAVSVAGKTPDPVQPEANATPDPLQPEAGPTSVPESDTGDPLGVRGRRARRA